MFGLGMWELLLIVVVVLVIFGAGKLPGVMADVGKGVQAFKKSLKDGDDEAPSKKDKK